METQKDSYLRIRIEKDIKEEYLKYCKENCFSLSKKIRMFIENELKENGIRR